MVNKITAINTIEMIPGNFEIFLFCVFLGRLKYFIRPIITNISSEMLMLIKAVLEPERTVMKSSRIKKPRNIIFKYHFLK